MTTASSGPSAIKAAARRKTAGRRSMQRVRILVKRAVGEAVRRSRDFREDLRERRSRRSNQRLSKSESTLTRQWVRIATLLLRFGGASEGNSIKFFKDGDERLDDLWAEIDRAEKRIWFESYILENDRVGQRTLGALASAARRGCEVRVLLDAVGSSRLNEAAIAPLRASGARIEFFNPLFRWKRHLPLLRRDHRKIVIIDNLVAQCGGMNISEDYACKRYGNSMFLDSHLRVTGPCVRDLARIFADSWRHATHRRLKRISQPEHTGGIIVQSLASHGWQGRQAIQRSLRIAIRHSVQTCYLTSPYFIPPLRLIHAINRAARRGVDVRVLTAGRSDVPVVAMAARHIYGRLLKDGVRIFELQECVLHSKTVVVDGIYATVGSFNLDQWSDKRNLEVSVGMLDASAAQSVQEQFLMNLENSREVTLADWGRRSWWQRFVHWTAYQLLRL